MNERTLGLSLWGYSPQEKPWGGCKKQSKQSPRATFDTQSGSSSTEATRRFSAIEARPSVTKKGTNTMKRYYLPLLLLTLLLGTWTAGAQNSEPNSCGSGCRESHSECRHVARDDERVCRRDCKDAVRTATASEREICEVQGLTEKECRGRIITAARAASESCLPDCREGLKHQKKQCRHQTRICSQVCKRIF